MFFSFVFISTVVDIYANLIVGVIGNVDIDVDLLLLLFFHFEIFLRNEKERLEFDGIMRLIYLGVFKGFFELIYAKESLKHVVNMKNEYIICKLK